MDSEHLNFVIFFKGSSESSRHDFFNLCRKFHRGLFSNKNGGSPSSFLRYEQLNLKCRVFLLGFPVAEVIYYITIMMTSCLEVIGVSYGTITLLLRDTVL